MRIYAKIFCKTAVFGNNCSGRYIFVATIIAYLRHADRVGGFATPGWQHLRRYQPGANHNRVPPARCSLHSPTAHHTPYRHNGCGTITHRRITDQRIACHNAGERQRCLIQLQKASGASSASERHDYGKPHTVSVGGTGCVGLRCKKGKACRRYAIMVAHFHQLSSSLRNPKKITTSQSAMW